MNESDYAKLLCKLDMLIKPKGFEAHALQIGWYNDVVVKDFKLPYAYDTLAFVIVSSPDMFEKAFIPFVQENSFSGLKDPLDECMQHYFTQIKEEFKSFGVIVIHDFELFPNRRPKVLVQTAAHVSGAARYYQKHDAPQNTWDESKRIYGVCLHPKYGGWFAIRALLIFSLFKKPELPREEPLQILKGKEKVVELLNKFNDSWQDWSYRDVMPVTQTYSQLQRRYFAAKPGIERIEVLKDILRRDN